MRHPAGRSPRRATRATRATRVARSLRGRGAAALVAFGLTLPAVAASPAGEKPLDGFDAAGAARQIELERRYDAALDPGDLRAWMKRLSAHPHPLGSARGKENAEFIASLFRSWGYDTAIERFDVLFPTPKLRRLELVAPTRFTASLAEPPLAEDSTSGQTAEQLPTYNAYSIDGDVTAELVYVDYGRPEDYDELARHGVDVRGRIVLARYGGTGRAVVARVAGERGAAGCILYTDPWDEGYFQGEVYPAGPWRPERGVQRGAVLNVMLYPGDPLTPGVGATPAAARLPLAEAPTLTKVPVLPISYADARPLLAALGGPVAPEAWRGALPLTYHLGPGPAKVHLEVAFHWDRVPAWDVIARLAGGERPEEWVLRGNHHDAWVNGAIDPLSALVSLLAEAKAVGELAKSGWRPKRTIVFAAWDGEEPGLIGSTEWAEAHEEELRRHAAAYVSSDSIGRGFLGGGGTPSLTRFYNQVARDVVDPETKVSVADRLRAYQALYGGGAGEGGDDEELLRLRPPGAGTDDTAFVHHLGIASLGFVYSGEDADGYYHSIYDSFDYYTRLVDPGFEYGIALAQTAGRAVLRLADADVLPFELTAAARAVEGWLHNLEGSLDRMRQETAETNRHLDAGLYGLAADPREASVPPPRRDPVPFLDLAPLQNATARLTASARAFARAEAERAAGAPLGPEEQARLDAALIATERALLLDTGLPGRPWYRNFLFAPGTYQAYGVATLPAVREAVARRSWQEADEQAVVTARVIEGYAAAIDAATALLAAPAEAPTDQER